jgi:lipopolysaccharide export system permease protein
MAVREKNTVLIIKRHIVLSFMTTFVVTLIVLTFVVSIGAVFKIADLLARDVSASLVMRSFLCGIPFALMFSIPISALTASLLVFGRLSSDNEITAMKACGVSMWQIASAPLLVSVLLMTLCLYINTELAPMSHYARRKLMGSLLVSKPLALLEEGRFIRDFEGLIVYLGRRKGNNIKNVRILELGGTKREIQARSGVVSVATNRTDLIIDLFEVRIDPFDPARPGAGYCGTWRKTIKDALRTRSYTKRVEDMNAIELIYGMQDPDAYFSGLAPEDQLKQRTAVKVELNKRIALSAACFAFVIIGIPLGVTAHRKESSVGVGISLFLVFNFYLFIIVAESLARYPQTVPELIVWLPVLLFTWLGYTLIQRTG